MTSPEDAPAVPTRPDAQDVAEALRYFRNRPEDIDAIRYGERPGFFAGAHAATIVRAALAAGPDEQSDLADALDPWRPDGADLSVAVAHLYDVAHDAGTAHETAAALSVLLGEVGSACAVPTTAGAVTTVELAALASRPSASAAWDTRTGAWEGDGLSMIARYLGLDPDTDAGAVLGYVAPDPSAPHRYLSTGCLHDQHHYCQSMTGMQGEKRPGRCKFCDSRCICACHVAAGPQPRGHRVVAALSRDDRTDLIAAAIENACECAAITVTVREDNGTETPLRRLARCLDGAGLIDWKGLS